MNRQDEIKAAASKHARGWNPTLEVNSLRLHDSLMYQNFIAGAEWADANANDRPLQKYCFELETRVKELQKYEDPAKCNSGHDTGLPVKLWTCPVCYEKLQARVKRLTEALKIIKDYDCGDCNILARKVLEEE